MPTKKTLRKSSFSIAILLGAFVIAIAIIITTTIQFFTNKQESDAKAKSEKAFENISYVNITNSPTLGNKNAPVILVEYTDFDCPICKQTFDTILPQIQKEYINNGKVLFVYKHLPIEEIHPTALEKAEAAMCARDQGGDEAFFQFHNVLFQQFDTITPAKDDAYLFAIAEKNGLDMPKFNQCIGSKKYRDSVQADGIEAQVIGSVGTPTWLLGKNDNGKLKDAIKIQGLLEYKVFQTIINQLLAR